jgi:two-component system, cell cycle response regulator
VKILVADDDGASLLLLKAQLRKAGHEVTVARDGQQAWTALEKDSPSVLVTDCMMPEMDGFELCRRLRAHATGPYTYVILLTAHEGREEYRKGMEAGADDFLQKPLDPDQLHARLRVAERIVLLEREVASLKAKVKS